MFRPLVALSLLGTLSLAGAAPPSSRRRSRRRFAPRRHGGTRQGRSLPRPGLGRRLARRLVGWPRDACHLDPSSFSPMRPGAGDDASRRTRETGRRPPVAVGPYALIGQEDRTAASRHPDPSRAQDRLSITSSRPERSKGSRKYQFPSSRPKRSKARACQFPSSRPERPSTSLGVNSARSGETSSQQQAVYR